MSDTDTKTDKEKVQCALDSLDDLDGVPMRFDIHEKLREAAELLSQVRRVINEQ